MLFLGVLNSSAGSTSRAAAFLPTIRSLKDAEELRVFVEPAAKSLQIRWRGPDDVIYALGGIDEKGRLLTNSINWKPSRIGRLSLSHQYLDRLASLVGGKVRQTKKPEEWYVVIEGSKGGYYESLPQAVDLLARSGAWLEIIRHGRAKFSDRSRICVEVSASLTQ